LFSFHIPQAAHDWVHRNEHSDLRAALFLFCVSHIVLVAQPSPRVEMEWVRCLRVLQTVKEQAGPMLHSLLTAAAVAKMIDVNVHFLHSNMAPVKVTPILAFVFDDVRRKTSARRQKISHRAFCNCFCRFVEFLG
jgi:hypothetical protein